LIMKSLKSENDFSRLHDVLFVEDLPIMISNIMGTDLRKIRQKVTV
jgi:hypothetical protein